VIITVGGIKGGTGKSTIATHLAVMRQRAGHDVLLVDADEQKSASEFAEQREALGQSILPCIQLAGTNVRIQIQELRNRYGDIIIDTGGRDTTSQRSALLRSDLLLLPFQPGNFDLWTVEQVEQMVSEIRSAQEVPVEAVAFISRGYPGGADNEEAAALLRRSEVLRFIDTPIIARKAFNTAIGEGLSVSEMKKPDLKAVGEMQRLYNVVFGIAVEAAA
jgi:chromosome partitioning protein